MPPSAAARTPFPTMSNGRRRWRSTPMPTTRLNARKGAYCRAFSIPTAPADAWSRMTAVSGKASVATWVPAAVSPCPTQSQPKSLDSCVRVIGRHLPSPDQGPSYHAVTIITHMKVTKHRRAYDR